MSIHTFILENFACKKNNKYSCCLKLFLKKEMLNKTKVQKLVKRKWQCFYLNKYYAKLLLQKNPQWAIIKLIKDREYHASK